MDAVEKYALLGQRQSFARVPADDLGKVLAHFSPDMKTKDLNAWELLAKVGWVDRNAVEPSRFNTTWVDKPIAWMPGPDGSRIMLGIGLVSTPVDAATRLVAVFQPHHTRVRQRHSSEKTAIPSGQQRPKQADANILQLEAPGANTKGVLELLQGSHSFSGLLATMTSLDTVAWYADQIARREPGLSLDQEPIRNPSLKRQIDVHGALSKLADKHEQRGYRFVLDGLQIVGYAGIVRLQHGTAAKYLCDMPAGADPTFESALTGPGECVCSAYVSALCLDPASRNIFKRGVDARESQPVFRIGLIRAITEIIREFAEVNQFVLDLWTRPRHPDEQRWFERLADVWPQAVVRHDGEPPLFRVKVWPDGFGASAQHFPALQRRFHDNEGKIARLVNASPSSVDNPRAS